MYDEDNSREVDYQEMENVMKVSEAVQHSFNGNPRKILPNLFIQFEYKQRSILLWKLQQSSVYNVK